jgi:cell division septum initiation protein DivIVA
MSLQEELRQLKEDDCMLFASAGRPNREQLFELFVAVRKQYQRAADALDAADAKIAELRAKVAGLTNERDELQRCFDLMWEADMRAITLWQKATGRDLTWPDRSKLTAWLLDQADAAWNEAIEAAAKVAETHVVGKPSHTRDNHRNRAFPSMTSISVAAAIMELRR